jgi:hypothetical protein
MLKLKDEKIAQNTELIKSLHRIAITKEGEIQCLCMRLKKWCCHVVATLNEKVTK